MWAALSIASALPRVVMSAWTNALSHPLLFNQFRPSSVTPSQCEAHPSSQHSYSPHRHLLSPITSCLRERKGVCLGLLYAIESFTNFMECWIIALLYAFSSKSGTSDVIAVGERAVVCKKAKWTDDNRYSFPSSFSFSSSSLTLLSHWYSHFMFSVTTSDCSLLAVHPTETKNRCSVKWVFSCTWAWVVVNVVHTTSGKQWLFRL